MLEYYGFAQRHDFSGVRGGLKRPLTKRDMSYPYDRDFPPYGSPQSYDRGSGPGRDAGGHQIVPKDTTHTPWDGQDGLDPEPTDEVLGFPMLIGKSQNGDGSGRTIPGTSGDWANAPFDDEVSDDELDAAADDQQVLSRMPVGRGQFSAGVQKRSTRRESTMHDPWNRLKEAFVSLKSTPEGQMSLSTGVKEAELEQLRTEFAQASADVEANIEAMEEAEIVKMLFDLDPDHASQSFADLGKDQLAHTYRSWSSKVMGNTNDQELDPR